MLMREICSYLSGCNFIALHALAATLPEFNAGPNELRQTQSAAQPINVSCTVLSVCVVARELIINAIKKLKITGVSIIGWVKIEKLKSAVYASLFSPIA
jgi:hypothetical protein